MEIVKTKKQKRAYPSWRKLFRYARVLNKRGVYALVEAEVFLKILCIAAIFPLGGLLWKFAFMLSSRENVTNSVADLLLSPPLALAALTLGVGLSVLTLFENLMVIRGVDLCHRREPIRIWKLFWRAAKDVFAMLKKPANWVVLLFTAVLVPFNNGYMTMSVVHALTMPEYIEEHILETPILLLPYLLVLLLLSWAVFHLIFTLHYMLLKGQGLKEAVKSSMKATKGRALRVLIQTGAWDVIETVKLALIAGGLCVAGFTVMWLILPNTQTLGNARGVFGMNLAVSQFIVPFISYFANVILTVRQTAYFSSAYYHEEAAEERGLDVREVELGVEKEKTSRSHLASLTAIVALALALSVFISMLFANDADEEVVASYMEGRKIEISSHRGYSAVAPENTVPAIQAAIDSGVADYAEIDVQMTLDGVVVLSHDTTLKRCTGVDLEIAETPCETVKALDASVCFPGKNGEFRNTPVPTLQEVMDVSRGRIKLMIEIKANSKTPRLEEEVVRLIRDNRFEDECCVISLDYESLEKVKSYSPDIETGYVMSMGLGDYSGLPAADFFSVESTFVNLTMIDQIHLAGKKVAVWTVDKRENAEKFIAMGVDNIVTGDPPMVYEAIQNERDSWRSGLDEMARFTEDFQRAE